MIIRTGFHPSYTVPILTQTLRTVGSVKPWGNHRPPTALLSNESSPHMPQVIVPKVMINAPHYKFDVIPSTQGRHSHQMVGAVCYINLIVKEAEFNGKVMGPSHLSLIERGSTDAWLGSVSS